MKPCPIRVRTLLLGTMAHRGVDAEAIPEEPLELARSLAQKSGAVVVISGNVDVVTDGRISYQAYNGHPMMRFVTSTGCQMSALIGACAPGTVCR